MGKLETGHVYLLTITVALYVMLRVRNQISLVCFEHENLGSLRCYTLARPA